MDLFKFKNQKWIKKREPILIKEVNLPKLSTGWLVIDSIGGGKSGGGIRLGNKVSLEEIKKLAAEMTLKRSFYNTPFGGAKAGIRCPNELNILERKDLFFQFGKSLKRFLSNEIYFPGTDMGTNQDDIDQLFKGARIKRKDEEESIDSGYYTALSVFAAIKAITLFKAIELRGARIGIQGLGKVGKNLLRLINENGLKLIAVSTSKGALYEKNGLDIRKITDLNKKYGDSFVFYYNNLKKIKLEEFFEKEMDIMCPCAGIYPINIENIKKIQSQIIVPGCNVAATEKIEKQIYERGITYLPGFVCNAGGVLGFTLKRFGIDKNIRSTFLSQGIKNKVNYLLRQSEKHRKAPSIIARKIVNKNQAKFALESKAGMKGKTYLAIYRWKHSGTRELLYSITWKLIERKLIAPRYIRKHLTKKIVFHRLFKS